MLGVVRSGVTNTTMTLWESGELAYTKIMLPCHRYGLIYEIYSHIDIRGINMLFCLQFEYKRCVKGLNVFI